MLYHGPCQLRGHRMGQPALELLRLVPGLEIELLAAAIFGGDPAGREIGE